MKVLHGHTMEWYAFISCFSRHQKHSEMCVCVCVCVYVWLYVCVCVVRVGLTFQIRSCENTQDVNDHPPTTLVNSPKDESLGMKSL